MNGMLRVLYLKLEVLFMDLPKAIFWSENGGLVQEPKGWGKFLVVAVVCGGSQGSRHQMVAAHSGFFGHFSILDKCRRAFSSALGYVIEQQGGGCIVAHDKVITIGGTSNDYGSVHYPTAKCLLEAALPEYEIRIDPELS